MVLCGTLRAGSAVTFDQEAKHARSMQATIHARCNWRQDYGPSLWSR
jgi:hypothetical protein